MVAVCCLLYVDCYSLFAARCLLLSVRGVSLVGCCLLRVVCLFVVLLGVLFVC